MSGELATTNLLLGIMAAVSVLEALVVLGIGIAAAVAYRRVTTVLTALEDRQVAPAMARVNAILDDVKGVTAKVKEETARVDRVRTTVRVKTSRIVGFLRGARVAVASMLAHHQPRPHHPF